EETGLRCRIGQELHEVRYRDRKGRAKRVRYWAMEPVDGAFRPNAEVDEVRWVGAESVSVVLSYPWDASVVADLCEVLSPV
ncbi:MAG: NUDIX domain-containing protein, partial [Acidimicrobiales bacterium]